MKLPTKWMNPVLRSSFTILEYSLSLKTCSYEHSQYDMKHSKTKEQSVEFPPWSEQFGVFFFLNQIFAHLCSYSVSKALLKKHTVWGAGQRNLQVTSRVKWSRVDGWMDDLACSFHTEALIKLLRRLLYLRIEREGKHSLIFRQPAKNSKCLIRCVTRLKNHASTQKVMAQTSPASSSSSSSSSSCVIY